MAGVRGGGGACAGGAEGLLHAGGGFEIVCPGGPGALQDAAGVEDELLRFREESADFPQ